MAVNMTRRRSMLLLLMVAYFMIPNVDSFECYKCDGKCDNPKPKETCAAGGGGDAAPAPTVTTKKPESVQRFAADPQAGEPAVPANTTAAPGGDANAPWKCFTATGTVGDAAKTWKGCTQADDTCPGADATAKDYKCVTCDKELCNGGMYVKATPLSLMTFIAMIFLAISQF